MKEDQYQQNHSGTGNNIVNQTIINADIDYAFFKAPITGILRLISEYHLDLAKEKIRTLKQADKKKVRLTRLLDVLDLKATLIVSLDKESIKKERGVLTQYLIDEKDEWAKDIILSTLLHVECIVNRDDAVLRIKKVGNLGRYTKELYYLLLAPPEELIQIYDENKLSLTEEEFYGIFSGLAQSPDNERDGIYFSKAAEIAEKFYEIYPDCNNASLCMLWSEYNQLLLFPQTYFLTFSQKKQVENFINELVKKIKDSSGNSIVLFKFACGVRALFTHLDYLELDSICFKYIDKLDCYPLYIDKHFIQYLKDKNTPQKTNDPKRDNEVITSPSNKFNTKQVLDLVYEKDPKEITAIINDKPIEFETTNGIEQDLLEILLLSCSYINTQGKQDELGKKIDSFFEQYVDELKAVHTDILTKLIEQIIKQKLSKQACTILEKVLPTDDLWCNPLVLLNIQALFELRSLQTLSEFLNKIKGEWNDYVHQAQAIIYDRQNLLPEAIESIKHAIDLVPMAEEYWQTLLRFCYRAKLPSVEILKSLNEIPRELIEKPSQFASSVIYSIASLDSFYKIEPIFLKWFLYSPEESARYLTEIYHKFCITVSKAREEIEHLSQNLEGFVGVDCEINGKSYLKLIAKNYAGKNAYILDSESDLARELLSLKEGEMKSISPTKKIKLLKKIPPIALVYNVCLQLRDEINDGTDDFAIYEFDKNDPDAILKKLEEISQYGASNEQRIDYLKDSHIPITLKIHNNKNDPLRSAFKAFSDINIYKHDFINIGIIDVEKVVVDLCTVAYLVITGLVKGIKYIDTRFYISLETKLILDNFLEQNCAESYILNGIELFLDHSEVLAPKLADIPLMLLEEQDPLLAGVIQLVVTTKTPWLCYDAKLCDMMIRAGIPIVNSYCFFASLAKKIKIDDKLKGFSLLAEAKLPLPIFYQDIYTLIEDGDIKKHLLASKIINNTHLILNKEQLYDLAMLTVHILTKVSPYKTHLFNAIMNHIVSKPFDQQTFDIEKKFSYFYVIITMLIKNNTLLINTLNELSTNFARGHFLSIIYINELINSIIRS